MNVEKYHIPESNQSYRPIFGVNPANVVNVSVCIQNRVKSEEMKIGTYRKHSPHSPHSHKRAGGDKKNMRRCPETIFKNNACTFTLLPLADVKIKIKSTNYDYSAAVLRNPIYTGERFFNPSAPSPPPRGGPLGDAPCRSLISRHHVRPRWILQASDFRNGLLPDANPMRTHRAGSLKPLNSKSVRRDDLLMKHQSPAGIPLFGPYSPQDATGAGRRPLPPCRCLPMCRGDGGGPIPLLAQRGPKGDSLPMKVDPVFRLNGDFQKGGRGR